jgi:hypothetical protein
MSKESKKSNGTKKIYKSAKTGKFVSKAAAARWPNRTYEQTVPVKKDDEQQVE